MKLEAVLIRMTTLHKFIIKQGEKEKADSLWRKALQTQDLAKKVEILSTYLDKNKKKKIIKLRISPHG